MRINNQFQISESKVPELSTKRLAEQVRAIINYEVIEKTKSYTMIRIKFLSVVQNKRAF